MEVLEIQQRVENNISQIEQMVDTLIGDSVVELDNYLAKVKQLFLSNNDICDRDLDRIIDTIPILNYDLIKVLTRLDIGKGVSGEDSKYTQNDYLLQATGTVAEKQAKAENSSVNNRIVSLAYKSATAKIQARMNGALEILSSAKRVQNRRLEEMKLTKIAGNSVGAF